MYVFFDKIKKAFDDFNNIWEKISNINQKKFNSELIYNKKYLKDEDKINTKKGFQCFYTSNTSIISISIILIDLFYRNDEHYYPGLFREISRILLKNILMTVMKKLQRKFE